MINPEELLEIRGSLQKAWRYSFEIPDGLGPIEIGDVKHICQMGMGTHLKIQDILEKVEEIIEREGFET